MNIILKINLCFTKHRVVVVCEPGVMILNVTLNVVCGDGE